MHVPAAGSGPAVAVLGGTGWLGRHVCAGFARRGYRVLAVARHPARHLPPDRFHRLDLGTATAATIAELLRAHRVAVVVNATDGANANDGWERTEAELVRANLVAVRRLLAALAALPGRPRLVHIGTIHEYGPVPSGTAVPESMPPNPVHPYPRSKLAGSAAVLAAARSGWVDATVLRLANLCGPYPSPASFPGKLLHGLRAAVAGEPVSLPVAESWRDYLDVRDAAEAVVRAAGPAGTGQVINIGRGEAVRLPELVRLALAAAGLPPGAVGLRPGPVASLGGDWSRADIRLAARLLGWRPQTSLADSLRAMWLAG